MTVMEEQPVAEEAKIVPLTLRPRHNVQWTEDTIDNEHMNKRKSKSKLFFNSTTYNIDGSKQLPSTLIFPFFSTPRVFNTRICFLFMQFVASMRSRRRTLTIRARVIAATRMMTMLVITMIATHDTNAKQCVKTNKDNNRLPMETVAQLPRKTMVTHRNSEVKRCCRSCIMSH